MRIPLLAICFAIARVAGATCLDDCLAEFGGAGPDYAGCVADCGVCGNGEIEGDEECDDGNTVGGDCCDAHCQPEPAGSPCAQDPDEPCTTAACDGDGECDSEEEPAPDCREPTAAGGATLVLRDSDDDAKDLLLWKWRRGPAASKAEFGDPLASTGYALCVYDDTGLLTTVTAPAGDTCGHHPCWAERGGGFRYRDPERTPDGAAGILLQPGHHDGRTKIVVEASGENLDLPDLSSLESPLTVQLRRSGSRLCWSAGYSFPPARRNDAMRFRDRSDAPPPTVATTTSTTTTSEASSTTVTTEPGATTTTTLAGASVEVTVVDAAATPVADADVTITYAGGDESFDSTDDTGVVVFSGQPVGVAATIVAEDLDDRTGSATSAGFAAGQNQVTVTVR